MRPDARPQVWKNRRRSRWNTLRIFWAENDADGRGSFAAVEGYYSDRLLGGFHTILIQNFAHFLRQHVG